LCNFCDGVKLNSLVSLHCDTIIERDRVEMSRQQQFKTTFDHLPFFNLV
jgi:hypothetical protein